MAHEETFNFVVRQPGLYPFRFLWYERGGSGYGEFYSVNRANPAERTLINDPNTPGAIKAYIAVSRITLQSAADVTGPYIDDAAAALDLAQGKFTLPTSGATRFYRVRGSSAQHITSIRLNGGTVEIQFAPVPQ